MAVKKINNQQSEIITYVLNLVELTGTKNHNQYEKYTPIISMNATKQEYAVLKEFFKRTGVTKERILTDKELTELCKIAKSDINNVTKKVFRFENLTTKKTFAITKQTTLLTQFPLTLNR